MFHLLQKRILGPLMAKTHCRWPQKDIHRWLPKCGHGIACWPKRVVVLSILGHFKIPPPKLFTLGSEHPLSRILHQQAHVRPFPRRLLAISRYSDRTKYNRSWAPLSRILHPTEILRPFQNPSKRSHKGSKMIVIKREAQKGVPQN